MLKAGFARFDITPPLGTFVAGETYPRYARGVLDPLFVNALALADGEKTVVMMTLDFLGISMKRAKQFRDAVTERTGVPTECIMISALHQHTATAIWDGDDVSPPPGIQNPFYLDILIRKIADAAELAIADLAPAQVGVFTGDTARPISYVRRYVVESGDVVTNPSLTLKPQRRCDEADNSVRLVRFIREGAPDIALVNFSTHPDVVGADFYPTPDIKLSADWPGFVRRFVEQDNPDTHCLVFTGTQGDTNHIDFLDPKTLGLHGNGYAHAQYMARTIADVVKEGWDKLTLQEDDALFAEETKVYNRINTEGIDEYDRYAAWYADYKAGKLEKTPYFGDVAYAERIIGLRNASAFRPVPLAVIGIGKVAMVGFGGEAFTAYSTALAAMAPDKYILTAVCTNGYQSYLPTAKALTEGGYEAARAVYTPALEGELLSAAEGMLKKF